MPLKICFRVKHLSLEKMELNVKEPLGWHTCSHGAHGIYAEEPWYRLEMIVNTGALPRRGGLHITLNRTEAVYRGGEVLTGTASLELQDSLEIIGGYSCVRKGWGVNWKSLVSIQREWGANWNSLIRTARLIGNNRWVFRGGELLTGTVSLELQDSLEIIG